MNNIEKISDDMLEAVSGGAANRNYSVAEYDNAGVISEDNNGKTIYSVKYANGTTRVINDNAAKSMVESYKLSNQRLSDKEIDALIAQC